MPVIERQTAIAAPARQVFEYVEDPDRIPEFAPGVSRVEDVQRTGQHIGDAFRVVYSVLGISFPTRFVVTEYAAPRTLASRMDGAMMGDFRWELTESEGGTSTQVAVRIDYEVKGGVLGKAINAVLLERMNEKNAERMLENLKLIIEQPPKAESTGGA